MVTDYSVNELISMLSEEKKKYKVAIWYATLNVPRWDENDTLRFVQAFLNAKYAREIDCINWNCTFILHCMAWLNCKELLEAVSILLTEYLRLEDDHAVSYAAETLARANYFLSSQSLANITGFFKELVVERFDCGTLQNLALLGWGVLDYLKENDVVTVCDSCKRIEQHLHLELYNAARPIEHKDIVFYISDYLSGKSFLQPPTAEIYAATMLGEIGVSSAIFDNRLFHYSIEHFIECLKKAGVSTVVADTTPYDQVSIYYVDYRLNRIIYDVQKLLESGIEVICVGSHVTVKPQEFFELTRVKYGIKGDVELTLLELAKHTDGFKRMTYENVMDVPNMYINNGTGLHYSGDDMSVQRPDISLFPMPDYEYVDISKYYGDEYVDNEHRIKSAWGSVLAQRGCPFHCSFCFNFFGRKVRARTPKQVVDELELLEKKYGVQHIFFIDYTFTADKKWVRDVCNLICSRELNIKWNCETRVDCLDEDTLDCMKRANCSRIWLGVETFNDELLNTAEKGINEEKIVEIIRSIIDKGIRVSCFLMLGLPGENANTIRHSLEQIKKCGIEYTKSIITFIPREGTKLFDILFQGEPASFYDMNRYKGIRGNEITEEYIISAIEQMLNRNVDSWGLGADTDA